MTNRRLTRASKIAKGHKGAPRTRRQRQAATTLAYHQHRQRQRNEKWKIELALLKKRWKVKAEAREQRRERRAEWRRRKLAAIVGFRPRWWRSMAERGWRATMRAAAAGLFGLIRQIPGWVWAPKPPKHRPKRHYPMPPPLPAEPTPAVAPPAAVQRPTSPPSPDWDSAVGDAKRWAANLHTAPSIPPPQRASSRKEHPMSDAMHPACEAAAEAFRDHFGGYHIPDNRAVDDLDWFMKSLRPMFEDMGQTVRGKADEFDSDTPIEHEVNDYFREVGDGLFNSGEGGDELYETWRVAQEHDILRAEEPRPNEEAFNV